MSGDAVTQAREAVLQGVVDQMNAALRAVGSDAEAVLETNRSTNLDAYAAAVRQQALADAEEKCARLRARDAEIGRVRERAALLAEVVAVVASEDEASGPMPDAVWSQFQMAVAWGDDRSGATAIIRGTISATKKSILTAIRALTEAK